MGTIHRIIDMGSNRVFRWLSHESVVVSGATSDLEFDGVTAPRSDIRAGPPALLEYGPLRHATAVTAGRIEFRLYHT